ncbi:hypothetical protein MIND_00945900 [Mycena indigotica]|uniref:Uncharacterized protein n=1 Tax=Mycena indigotica TaxID=2126181 RepID=A0A8H6SFY4_9AGAR|nr:uncharacterized protein MIND_00945900 [Mycena indigotica]KAF7297130.1 hypothetical protein MIND_00945900 [Mycena indigotica]
MWAKLTTALKPRQDSSSSSHGDVMAGVYEQHPNLSVFQNEPQPSPPPSPSKSRMAVFKRNTKTYDESQRAPSPMKLPGITKKVKSTFGIHGNSSQLSLGPSTPGPTELSRVDSRDMMAQAGSQSKRRSSFNLLKRGSIDELRSPPPEQLQSPTNADESRPFDPATPFDGKTGSVRSILRDRNTPGTGQNVRFFSRDAYRVLSPNQSMESEYQSGLPATNNALNTNDPFPTSIDVGHNSAPRFGSSNKLNKSRLTVAEIFSPEVDAEAKAEINNSSLVSELPPIPPPDFNLFEVSQDLEIPILPPPGLGFEVDLNEGGKPLTSTPFRDKGKGRAFDQQHEVDESIFHAKEKSPRIPSVLHDRSNSFSLGQTHFYSMAQSDLTDSPARRETPVSARSSPLSAKDISTASAASSPGTKGRGRSLSDTVFMSMLRSPSPKQPEADINDDLSSDLIVYNNQPGEPDPFSANANTYYTPQTMIPTTPPESQAGSFEADLRARDELVEVLGKKLESVEREESKKRAVLKQWKKKVLELERACRLLEEEVDTSRQESLDRSAIDMASNVALVSLHQQIADLSREKQSWERKEGLFRQEIQTLELKLKERGDDIDKLKETLLTRDESERELKLGISMVKEQMEMMGNVSVGLIDETELRKIAAGEGGTAESAWAEEKHELMVALDKEKEEKVELAAEVDAYKQQLDAHDEKLKILNQELEAQWSNTEHLNEMLETCEMTKRQLEAERDAQKSELEEMNERLEGMEAELTEADQRLNQDDADYQALWDDREALQKEYDELFAQVNADEKQTESAKQSLQESQDRVLELEQEHKYALDNIARLEENIRRRDAEVSTYSQRILEREAEIEALQEQLSRTKREHATALDAALSEKTVEAENQARDYLDRISDLKGEMERLRRQIHQLQQESADKEVKIVQLNKQHVQDKDDIQGYNIALDSKQQELELIKRKLGVRGTAGSTPVQPSKVGHQRRDSTIFSTPSLGSRPPSVISEAGSDGGSAGPGKMPALGKSTRLNTSTTKSATTRVVGSMGPPPAPISKPRASLGTPTPNTLSRSTSARPSSSAATPLVHRRVASATLDNATSRAVKSRQTVNASPAPGEKENMKSDSSRPASRTLARVAVPS